MYAHRPAPAGRRGVCMYAAGTKLRNQIYPRWSDTGILVRTRSSLCRLASFLPRAAATNGTMAPPPALKRSKSTKSRSVLDSLLLSLRIVFLGKYISIEDFTSLLDQLLLVDTLLLGFSISLMTGTTLEKQSYLDRDAWGVSLALQNNPNNITRPHYGTIQSYYVVQAGVLSVSFLFMSLGLALAAYLMLNLSEARESKRYRLFAHTIAHIAVCQHEATSNASRRCAPSMQDLCLVVALLRCVHLAGLRPPALWPLLLLSLLQQK